MPLHVLITLVVFGIAGIAVLCHVLGYSRPRRFDTQEAARAAWLREFPEIPPTEVQLCQSGTAALIHTAQGPGIVWPMGADSTARFLTGATMRHDNGRLDIRLPDYTAPRLTLHLTPDEALRWHSASQETA